MIPYSKLIDIEDFADKELRQLIRDIFAHELALFPANYPDGVADSKQWEIAMAVRTLQDHGVLRQGSRILGVGSGTEITPFYLSRHVDQVVATDLYFNAGPWADVAPRISRQSRKICEGRFRWGTNPAHAYGRAGLAFSLDSFDGVYSAGSIEHFGSLSDVASCAYEIGRVLKAGGIAAISTEFKVGGAPDRDGWDPNVILFTEAKLRKYIVEASGLDLIDGLDLRMSDATLQTGRDLSSFLEGIKNTFSVESKISQYPNLILYHAGFVFCSIHLALTKRDGYPKTDNSWAKPSAAIRSEARRFVDHSPAEGGASALVEPHALPQRPRRSLAEKVGREAKRFWRRRVKGPWERLREP